MAPGTAPTTYTADKSEIVVLANAFVDLGSYHGISPYVGAGAGVIVHDDRQFDDIKLAYQMPVLTQYRR
jgi:opacity protein-like surface antigen